MKQKSKMFDVPDLIKLTQGTIFSCAYSENYKNKKVYGIIITAKCDVAQCKAKVYNYIPVISINDWLINDCFMIFKDRECKNIFNAQKNILKEYSISQSVLETKTSDEIINHLLIPLIDKNPKEKKKIGDKINQFRIIAERSAQIVQAASQECDKERLALLKSSKSSKCLNGIIDELASNRLAGYYLLKEMQDIDDEIGDYVVLLREIYHISDVVANKIKKGMDINEWNAISDISSSRPNCPFFRDEEDYCMPVSKLKSPWIEHLMQSFTMLFARIGVDDVDYEMVRKSITLLNQE
jgi:hypothetical protein